MRMFFLWSLLPQCFPRACFNNRVLTRDKERLLSNGYTKWSLVTRMKPIQGFAIAWQRHDLECFLGLFPSSCPFVISILKIHYCLWRSFRHWNHRNGEKLAYIDFSSLTLSILGKLFPRIMHNAHSAVSWIIWLDTEYTEAHSPKSGTRWAEKNQGLGKAIADLLRVVLRAIPSLPARLFRIQFDVQLGLEVLN